MINNGYEGVYEDSKGSANGVAPAVLGNVGDIKLEEQISVGLQREKLSFHQV